MAEVAAVGAIAIHDGALLLIRRGRPPGVGLWSLPGGRVEPGESEREAVAREVAEETSLVVDVGELIGEVLRPGIGDVVYRIRDFAVSIISGSPVAGDDAADVAWVALDELAQWPLTEGLLDALTHWNVVTANTKRPQADKQVTDS